MILLWRVTTKRIFACGFCINDRRLARAQAAISVPMVERDAHAAQPKLRVNIVLMRETLPDRFRSARQQQRARVWRDCPSTPFFGKFAA